MKVRVCFEQQIQSTIYCDQADNLQLDHCKYNHLYTYKRNDLVWR